MDDSPSRPRPLAIDRETDDTALAVVEPTERKSSPGTLDSEPSTEDPRVRPGGALVIPALETEVEPRYRVRGSLGRGGMGEVSVCYDRRIGREVAIKSLRPPYGNLEDSRARFLREARIQGQLDHPAVVPVYDLGVDSSGSPCFTMKRVRGLTLAEVLKALAAGDADVTLRYSRRKLLTAFCTVCLTVDFAHTRGVIHRDLKPANIMFGDFGEVHVLDWGVACLTSETRSQQDTSISMGPVFLENTASGAVIGTPGYMAPEQARGLGEALDARSDVYALGSILFAILALDALHKGKKPEDRLQSTIAGLRAVPSARAPDREIPPELDEICLRATELERSLRFASARELCNAVERFLDGDRDLELRKAAAQKHAELALRALEQSHDDDVGAQAARAEAVRETSRALAFDPTHRASLAMFARLVLQPPEKPLPEVLEAEEAAAGRERLRAAKLSLVTFGSWFLALPLMLAMGVRNVALMAVGVMLTLACLGWSAFHLHRRHIPEWRIGIILGISSVLSLVVGAAAGSYVLLPPIVAANAAGFALVARRPSQRLGIMASSALSVLALPTFELLGWIPKAYTYANDSLIVHARLLNFPPVWTPAFLALVSTTVVLLPVWGTSRMREALLKAERQLLSQAWHLKKMVPEALER